MIPYDKYKDGPIHHEWYAEQGHWYKQVIDFALANTIGESVLDLGCGDGLFLKLATEKGLKASGIDISEEGVIFSRKLAPEATVYRADLEDHELRVNFDASWDTLVCINTIEHLQKPDMVPFIFKNQINKRAIIITDYPREEKGRYHAQEFSPQQLMGLFGYYGWDITKKFSVDELTDEFYAIIFDK